MLPLLSIGSLSCSVRRLNLFSHTDVLIFAILASPLPDLLAQPCHAGDVALDGTPLPLKTPCFEQASLTVNYSQPPTFTLTTL